MTPRLLEIFNSVLTAPVEEGQLTEETRAGLQEVIQFLHQQEPAMLAPYPALLK